jgi:hypothetical protein
MLPMGWLSNRPAEDASANARPFFERCFEAIGDPMLVKGTQLVETVAKHVLRPEVLPAVSALINSSVKVCVP